MRFPEPDRLRGVAIVFVVAIHAFSYLKVPADGAWSAVWFVVHQTAVPAFFLADGWLYGKRHRQAMSGVAQIAFLSSSARRLLLPWATFSILYLALRLVTQALGEAGGAPVQVNSPAAFLMAIWHGAAAEGLYFLPALMIVRLVTPQLHRLAAGSPTRALGLAILILVGWRLILEPRLPVPAVGVDPLLAAMTGLSFAAIGWALAEAPTRFALPAAIVPAVLLAGVGAMVEGRAAAMCFQTSAVLALWAVAVATPARFSPPVEWLGRRTMEIYLLHAPYIIKVSCALGGPAASGPRVAGGGERGDGRGARAGLRARTAGPAMALGAFVPPSAGAASIPAGQTFRATRPVLRGGAAKTTSRGGTRAVLRSPRALRISGIPSAGRDERSRRFFASRENRSSQVANASRASRRSPGFARLLAPAGWHGRCGIFLNGIYQGSRKPCVEYLLRSATSLSPTSWLRGSSASSTAVTIRPASPRSTITS